ncbi:hypothetical protein J4558_19855 [Leptolyngbya sp. 15MV]|nr:hypothetical protein J4558_19855 [Leptolyngbya sp. 15MV]
MSRTLDVDGNPAFHLRVFRPEPQDGGRTWRCLYEVEGPATRHVGSQCGVDGMQALLNSLYILSVEVEMSEEHPAKRLSWDGQSSHFGLPPPEADPERRGSS